MYSLNIPAEFFTYDGSHWVDFGLDQNIESQVKNQSKDTNLTKFEKQYLGNEKIMDTIFTKKASQRTL